MEGFVNLCVGVLVGYVGIGLVFAFAFVIKGVKKVDPGAQGGTFGFRLIILPGCAVFWPYLLRRWIKGTPPPEERSAHRTRSETD